MKRQSLFIALSAAFIAAGCATSYKNVADHQVVKTLGSMPRDMKTGALLIDTRPAATHFDVGHIPSSINIPAAEFDKYASRLPSDKAREIIFYGLGDDANQAATKAEALGYTNVKVYPDGIAGWEANGGILSVSTKFMTPYVLIDSRPERPFAQGHIPGAINISDSKFEKMTDLLPKDKTTPLIFYCGGYICDLSEKSAKKAKALGYTNVRKYTEGYPAYAAATGRPAPVAAAPAPTAATTTAPVAAMGQAMQAVSNAMTSVAKTATGVVIEAGKEKGSISVPSFERILKENPSQIAIIDVRDAKDVKGGTFPGAINIPINEIEKKLEALPKDKPVVFVCSSGARSGEAYDTVMTLGSGIKAYFLDAEATFTPDNKYTIKGR